MIVHVIVIFDAWCKNDLNKKEQFLQLYLKYIVILCIKMSFTQVLDGMTVTLTTYLWFYIAILIVTVIETLQSDIVTVFFGKLYKELI